MPRVTSPIRPVAFWLVCCGLVAGPAHIATAAWSITANNTMLLDTSGGFAVGELSGVTYLGPSPEVGQHRFLAVQDNGNGIVTIDTAFDLSGNLVSATTVGSEALSMSLDFEGIVQVGDSVFLSEENGPGVREFDSTTGTQLQNVNIPPLFASNKRNNFGFESLAYDSQNSQLWTANEEALTSDGPLSTSAAGTTVRLLELNLSGSSVSAGKQFAYETEPIHGLAIGSARSGLAELVSMPDGALLGLERSAAVASPALLNRIFEIDFTGATDVSMAPFNTGLVGQSYSSVNKSLLWSGGIGSSGENMEGLAVGPRLPNGDWILLGVVDDGDSFSSNTIVSFRAAPSPAISLDPDTGDFDSDTDVDGTDYLAWQRGNGVTTLAGLNHGDGNYDGAVTGADLAIWQGEYASLAADLHTIPEPSTLLLLSVAAMSVSRSRHRTRI